MEQLPKEMTDKFLWHDPKIFRPEFNKAVLCAMIWQEYESDEDIIPQDKWRFDVLSLEKTVFDSEGISNKFVDVDGREMDVKLWTFLPLITTDLYNYLPKK